MFSFDNISLETIVNLHFSDYSTKISTSKINKSSQDKKSHPVQKLTNTSCSFIGNSKYKNTLWVVMYDIQKQGPLPMYTSNPCRNCHHQFSWCPIGCPIFYSTANENTFPDKHRNIENYLKENNYPCNDKSIFETEHMFCSASCVKSYILEMLSKHPGSKKYKDALSYLTIMYKKIIESDVDTLHIPAAAPIEMLKSYGGPLTIEEYRAQSGHTKYEYTPNVKRPYMYCVSPCIREIVVDL